MCVCMYMYMCMCVYTHTHTYPDPEVGLLNYDSYIVNFMRNLPTVLFSGCTKNIIYFSVSIYRKGLINTVASPLGKNNGGAESLD